jgi:hypothetical protein
MQDWKVYRPAIWVAMLGVALALVVNPPYIGVVVIGVAIGIGIRIVTARRRVARGLPPQRRRRGRG